MLVDRLATPGIDSHEKCFSIGTYIFQYVCAACSRGLSPYACFHSDMPSHQDGSSITKGRPMKILFSLKDKLTFKKSLKAYAWYIWY